MEWVAFEGLPGAFAEFIGGDIGGCEFQMQSEKKKWETHRGESVDTYLSKKVHKKMLMTDLAINYELSQLVFLAVTTTVSINNLVVSVANAPTKVKKYL